MSIKRTLLIFTLIWGCAFNVWAQTGMTDNQVMQYMIKETERGTPRQEIVTSLIERGVSIEQIRRIKKKYEKQNDGSVIGARDISGSKGKNRLRSNNGDKKEELKGSYQRKQERKEIDKSSLSEKQRKKLEREEKSEYMDEMDELLPDSLDQWDFPEDDFYKEKDKEKKIKIFGHNIFNNRKLSFEPNMNIV